MRLDKIKNFVSERKDKILFTSSMTVASLLTPVVAFAADGADTVDLSTTVDTGISLLDKGYTFITNHSLLFATVALGIAFRVVYGMKGAFRR